MDIIIEFFTALTSEQVAFISVIVTILLFFIERNRAYRLKVYEIRKEQYIHLLSMFKGIYSNVKNVEAMEKLMTPEKYYEVGASLAIYGSRKLYRKYRFFREISINENLQKTKYFKKDMLIFAMGEMYQIIRTEIGLNNDFPKVDVPNILFFMLNDINKPEYRKKYFEYVSNKIALQTIIFFSKIDDGLPFYWLYNCVIISIIRVIYLPIYLLIKYLIIKPISNALNKDI